MKQNILDLVHKTYNPKYRCPECKGHGNKGVVDYKGQQMLIQCSNCHGTGKVNSVNKYGGLNDQRVK
jgi:DnaJ-class molecular chaperone